MPRARHQSCSDNNLIAELQEQIEGLNARLVQQGAQLMELRKARPDDNAIRIDRGDRAPEIPELIKLTPVFDGTPSALVSFIDSVEQKISASEINFSEEELINQKPIWIGLIRDKIVGRANEILVENQTPLVWTEIKATLKENLGDKREIATLLSSVNRLRQGSRSLEEYYQKCRALLTSLNSNTILNNPESRALRETYEILVINAFIDGLHEELNDFTRLSKSATLLEAFQAAQQQQQAIIRKKNNARRFAPQQSASSAGNTNARKYQFPKKKQTVATHEEVNENAIVSENENDASGDEANFRKVQTQHNDT